MVPSKTVRWEYYNDPDESDPVAIVEGHCEDALCNTMLGNNTDEETALRAMDDEITGSFSIDDVAIIIHALKRLGFSNDFKIETLSAIEDKI